MEKTGFFKMSAMIPGKYLTGKDSGRRLIRVSPTITRSKEGLLWSSGKQILCHHSPGSSTSLIFSALPPAQDVPPRGSILRQRGYGRVRGRKFGSGNGANTREESAFKRNFCKTESIQYEKNVLFRGLIKSAKIEQPALCLDNFRLQKTRHGRKFHLDHGGQKPGDRVWEKFGSFPTQNGNMAG